MTIDKIFNNGDLSVRSYHACKYNGIETVVDLNEYYEKRNTFIHLRNCGEKSNIELIELNERFNQKNDLKNKMNFNESQIEIINEFIKKKSIALSNRSLNAINKFFRRDLTINTFINQEIFKLDLSTIENIGKKSIAELNNYFFDILNFIEKLETNLDKKKFLIDTNSLSYQIKSLNRLQRQVINRFIINSTVNLKVRSRNAITLYVTEPLKLINFVENIFDNDNFQVSKIKNIGKASIPELINFLKNVKQFIFEVIDITEEKDLIKLNNSYLIQNTFSIQNTPNVILESQSIIKICDFLIKNNAFFKTDYNIIFHNTINVYSSDCTTLDETSSITNLTRERVRQIRQRCFLEIADKLKFLKNFEDDLYQNYEIESEGNFIIVKDEMIDEINFLYDTKFSKNFLIYIFSIYLSDSFTTIGNIEDVLIPKQFNARNRHNWKNIYLIKKEVQEKIDLNKLCEDVSVRLQEKIIETYSFNFKSYLSRFLIEDDFRILEIIKDDCETIIFEEFNIFLDLNEDIIFNRNTVKTASEYAFEALEVLEKPSKVEDIYLKIVELFPNFKTDKNKVRTSLKRKDGFTPIGRRSIFGLKKWENELENFKGGTIKDIIIEYLSKKNDPIHIQELLKEIHTYREKTTERNVITNLKLDPQNQFIIFNQSFIGLKNKKYESKNTSLPKFLGKTMTKYLRTYPNIHKNEFIFHFATKLSVSLHEIEMILNSLVDSGVIILNNETHLNYANTRN